MICKKITFAAILFAISIAGVAQPVITSISTYSAPINTQMTISGSGFSSTLTANVVTIGGVRATVTASSSSQLTITIPKNAAVGPINISVGGYSARSLKNFRPTNTTYGGRPVLATNFNTELSIKSLDYYAGSNNQNTHIVGADFDGNGHVDIAKGGRDSIRVHRNTYSSGSFSSTHLTTTSIVLTLTGNVRSLIAEDINSDGKIDLLAATGSRISIFRNSSSSTNSISFSTRIDYTTFASTALRVCDLDQDGELDLISLEGSTLNILKNQTKATSSSTLSFVSTTTALGSTFSGLGVSDLNNDGVADIIVTKSGETKIYLGALSNGQYTSLSPITIQQGHTNLAIGDFDLDGDDDIFLYRNFLRNDFASGSFAAQDLTMSAATYSIDGDNGALALCDLNGDGYTDVLSATSWDKSWIYPNSKASSFDASTFNSTELLNTSAYAANAGPSIGVDIDNDGRIDIITAGNNAYSYMRRAFSVFLNKIPVAPSISTNLTNLGTLDACGNTLSTQFKQFTVSGSNLAGSVTVAGGNGIVLSASSGGSYSSSLVLNSGGSATLSSTTVYVKFDAVNHSAGSKVITITSNYATNKEVLIECTTVSSVPSLSVSGNSRCGAGSITLNATPTNNGVNYWYVSSTGGTAITNTTGLSSYTISSVSATTTYHVESRNSCGTSSPRLPVTATINNQATWNGTGSWTDASNWNCGSNTIPLTTMNTTIATGTVTIDADLTLAGSSTLTISPGATLAIAPNFALTIPGSTKIANAGTIIVDASSSSAYGQLLLTGSTPYQTVGSGVVTVKKVYDVSSAPSYAKWIQFSSPVSGDLSQLGNIQANNLFYWDASSNNWEPTSGSIFEKSKGYTVYFGVNGVSPVQSGAITLSGVPFENISSPSLNWSNGVSNNALFYSSKKDGWNLIGNPFTCNLDFTSFTPSNVESAFYRWDPNKGGSGQAGYHAHSKAGAGVDLSDAIIPPMTAVWVRASSNSNPSLGTGPITHANNGRRGPKSFSKTAIDKFLLTVSDLSTPALTDNLSLAMVPGTSDEFDGEWDAWELINSNQLPNVYANFNAEWTTAKAVDFNDQASVVKVVPVGVKSPIEMRPYRMHLDANLAQPSYTVYLRDLHLNQVHNLSTSDYVFAYTSAMEDRFELILTNAKTGALGLEEASRGALTAWVSGSELWITGLESGVQEIDVVGMDGRVVFSTQLRAEEGQPVTTALHVLPAGLYTVRVRANGLERGVRFAVQR